MNLGPWHAEDFESLSWHDVHVHGFRLDSFNPEEGSADLILDIDFILKWQEAETGFLFTLCPAELRFHEVFGLKIELDYATPTAGICPFSISGISRESLEFAAGVRSFHWCISFNWPRGSLEFDAPKFTQTLMGKPIIQSGQWLLPVQRAGHTV